jgi:hypothetical protein
MNESRRAFNRPRSTQACAAALRRSVGALIVVDASCTHKRQPLMERSALAVSAKGQTRTFCP